MKLYAIIYILGRVVATVGPWPPDSDDACEAARLQQEIRFDQAFSDHRGEMTMGGHRVWRAQIWSACEYRATRPVTEEPFDADDRERI